MMWFLCRFEETKHDQADAHNNQSNEKSHGEDEEEIEFKGNPFQIPPLFNQLIREETLLDNDCPYVFWVSLHLPIPKDPVNPMAVVYNALEEFVTQLAEEDPHFVIYPHNLSE